MGRTHTDSYNITISNNTNISATHNGILLVEADDSIIRDNIIQNVTIGNGITNWYS